MRADLKGTGRIEKREKRMCRLGRVSADTNETRGEWLGKMAQVGKKGGNNSAG